MANRRSLKAVLDLPTQQRNFIQGGAAEPASDDELASLPCDEQAADPVAQAAEEQPQRRTPTRRSARVSVPQGDKMPFGFANLLVPVTTKLRPATAAALKRAGLEQRLRGKNPATVQEIAEQAIQKWLLDSGYLE